MGFAFDANRHEYVDLDLGEIVPHITGMLEQAGWVDARWYTEESSERGRVVHQLTADFDLGVIEDAQALVSKYKGWLLSHVRAMHVIRPEWRHVEEPLFSKRYHFGGRPDRSGLAYGEEAVLEIKSGAHEKSHGIQLALQAILVGEEGPVPAEHLTRYGLYLSDRGKFKLEQFIDRRDFDEARRIITLCCGS